MNETETTAGAEAAHLRRQRADSVGKEVLQGRRVVIVLETLELGGAERQALRLAEGLIRDYRTNVQIWGFADEGRVARACEAAGISWRLVPPYWGEYRTSQWLHAAIRFAFVVRKARAEILLPYCARSNIICGLSWRLAGAKACIWNQRDEGIGIEPDSFITRCAVRCASTYVGNSKNTADYLARTFAVPLKGLSIVHNGVELAQPISDRSTWRERLRLTPNSFVACMLANIHHNKDHATLLEAWRIVLDNLSGRYDQAVLLLAGWLHPTADELKNLARELNLGSSVRFLGPVDDVAGLLSASDLGVFSSRSEGCPNGLLECMASGLPVVGTDIGGIREAVGPAGQEHLAPAGDPETFAQRVLFLAKHTDLAFSLGKAHRDRVRCDFSTNKMVERMVEIIMKALNRRHSSPVGDRSGDSPPKRQPAA